MAPAADYLFLSIQTLINTISLIIVIPCIIALVRTQGIHRNCKVLLVTSASLQMLILCVQTALFAYNFITENLRPLNNEKQRPFEMLQILFFTMSSYLSVAIVIERTYAVRHAAEYERSGRHFLPVTLISACLLMAILHVFVVYSDTWVYVSIFALYRIEYCTLFISFVIIIYARLKLRNIPFDGDRLGAMYQVREVLTFSMAILPSVIVSCLMHTLSLVPTILWLKGFIAYPVCCLFYYSVHSLNCAFTLLTLILCRKGMRQRFQLIFLKRISTPKGARMKKDAEKEGQEYFMHMRMAWDSVPKKEEKMRSRTLINTASIIVGVPCVITLVRTQGIHGNCKVLLVASALIQMLSLCVQQALFVNNYITENLMPLTDEKQRTFELVQNALFMMSSYLTPVMVLERVYAVRHAAEYEKIGKHMIPLLIIMSGCIALSIFNVHMIFMHSWFYHTISFLYAVEACTLIISVIIIVYARSKIRNIPFDEDRLNAMYQVREVLAFSIAILPSVIVSSIMHTLSLVPTLLWLNGVISYPICCVFYFSAHSLNCILTKLTLIVCHKGMRQRFLQFFVKSVSTTKIISRDADQESRAYFEQLKAAWDR